MTRDFDRIYKAIKIVLLQSDEDRPDLVLTLVRQRARFLLLVVRLHVQLELYRWDLGSPEVHSLFELFSAMRGELTRHLPMPEASAA
jgi:hypothetical protein